MSPLFILGGLALGTLIGAISGVIGIGGGALLIPALVYFYGMSQIKAQGTSLATLLLPIGFFAFRAYYRAGHADLKLAIVVAVGFALGGVVWRNLGTVFAGGRSAAELRFAAGGDCGEARLWTLKPAWSAGRGGS